MNNFFKNAIFIVMIDNVKLQEINLVTRPKKRLLILYY